MSSDHQETPAPAPAPVEPDWTTVGILGSARGARSGAGDSIGTEHLLAGVTDSKGEAADALAGAGVTRKALLAVLRDRLDRPGAWTGTDDADRSIESRSRDVLGEDGDKGIRLTGAAARALRTAMAQARREGAKKLTAELLLRGLLSQEDSRAAEALRICRTSPAT
ncbi:Clp protease N-terminal domain-containing protein, partial [Streptomyces sp. NPDC055078]